MPLPITLSPVEQTLPMDIDRQGLRGAANYEIANSSQFNRGWQSAGIGEDANALMSKSLAARMAGDHASGDILEQQARDLHEQGAQWAPTVKNMTDVNGLGSAVDWVGGAMGNMRSSVMPAVGGLAGAAIGGVAGALSPMPGGAAVGARYGAGLGSALLGGKTEYDEAVSNAMMDQQIRNTRTYEDIHNAALVKGGINAGLEGLVPFGMTKSLLGVAGKQVAKGGALKAVGKEVGKNMLEEGATEGTQSLVGQGAENWLKRKDLTDFDYKQALNEAAAGAVAGGGMGAITGAADVAHSGIGKGVDKAREIKSDPLGTILDAGVDLAAKAGTAKAKLENYLDERELKKQGFTDDQIAEKTLEKLFSGKRDDVAAPHSPEEKLMEPMAFDNKRKESADRKAAEILKANSQTVHPDVRQAAVDYASGKIDWLEFGKRENDALKTQSVVDDTDAALAALEGRGSKKSMMKPTLTDDFGEQEGRAMTGDTVTNDFGDQVGKQGLLRKDLDNKVPDAPFNYNSAQRTGAIDKAQRTDNSNRLTSEISPAVQRVAQVREEIYKTKTTEAQAIKDRDTVDLAKLIVNNFGTDKEVAKAARNATENDAHVSSIAGMITWARFGFQRSENQEVLDALVKTYGASASKIMRKAYEQGVHQGIVERNDEKAGAVEQALERTHVDSTARYDAVIGNLTPTARAKADGNPESVAKLLSLLQDIVSRGEKGGNTKDGAGVRSATDKAVLKALFGTEENIRAALAKFVEPKSKDVLVEDKGGKDEQDGSDLSAAVDALETEGESSLSESGNTINTTAKHTDLKRADGKLFDKRDLAHRAEMDALRKKHSAVKSGEVMGNEVEEVGVVTQALAGLDTDEARQAAKRDIVHEYFPKLDRIGDGPAEDASLLLKRDFATRLRKYNRKINALAIGLDKRHVALRVTEREMERMPLEFSRKVVEGLELQHMNLDDPKNGPHKGVLVFEMADKNGQVFADSPFKTSGPMIMRQMFRLREAMGDAGSSYKDGVKGTAQGALRLLSDGITSIITEKDLGVAMHLPKNPLGYFTGRYGYVMAGKTTWIEGASKLPDDFMLYRDKKLGPQTAGMAAEQEKDQSKSTKSVDFDPEDVETGIVTKKVVTADEKLRALLSMTEKRTDISPQAIGEIHGLAAQVEAFEKILLRDTEEGKKLIAKQSAVIEGLAKSGSHEREGELAKLKHFNTVALHKTAQGRAKKVVLGKKINALYKQYGLNSTTSEQRATKHEQERAVDGLSGYDKRGEAALGTRTERGDINSGDDTMLAQAGTVGRSRSGTAPVATRKVGDKIVDERVSDNVSSRSGLEQGGFYLGKNGTLAAGPDPVRQVVRKPEAATTTPMSSRAYVELLRVFEGKVRGVSASAIEDIDRVLRQAPALGELMGNVLHTAVAVGDEKLDGAYMLAQPLDSLGGWTIILSERAEADAKGDPGKFIQNYGHEIGHSLENAGVFNIAKDFARDGEMAAEAKGAHGDLKETLRYPMGKSDNWLDDKKTDFHSEFHATLFGLYQADPSGLKTQMPKTYAILESAYGKEGKIFERASAGTERSEGEGDESSGVNVRQERSDSGGASSAASGQIAKNKLIKQLESVKTYTPRHRAAVRNALAILKGTKEGDITEALEAVLASSEYFGKNVKTEAQAEIEEMNEAVADAADDYYEHERSRESGERDYAAEYEDAQGTELGPEPVVEEQVVETAPKQSSEAQQLQAYLDQHGSKNAPWAGAARKAIASNNETQIRNTLAAGKKQFGKSKQSTQQPKNQAKGKLHERVAAAEAHILKTIGSKIEVVFERMTDGSGSWTPGQHQNTIKLALNGDVLGAAFHESFHEFMDILRKNAATKTADVLQRAAMNPMIQRKLERLLDGHPEAIAQLKDPEEAAAFMYQFWSAGLLKIGPETRTAFDTVKNFLKKVAGFFSETFRSEVESMTREQLEAGHAELLLRQFSEGAVANMDTRQMVVEAMEKNTEVHNAAVERVGSAFNAFANTAGKLVFSSEAMMEATGNKHMVEIMRGMHQKVGTAMRQFGRSTGAYSDGLRQNTSHWMHKVEAALAGYSKEDLELARAALSQEKEPTDRVAKEIVDKVNTFYGEMAQYMKTKGVKRLNMDRIDPVTNMKGVWEDIPLRKNYLSQVWSIDKLMESLPEFKADLLKHHMKELEALAVEANKELKDMKGIKAGTAAGIELERADKEFKDSGKVMAKMNLQTITPEMIADAIGTRLLASHGHIEISESTSGMGITPAASAVNKRELNWLDKEVFDKYKEKDLTNILTTYTHSIVKRGEFQSRFGPAGEVIAEGADKAVLFELGGDALVDKAVAKLPAAKKAWAKAKAENGEAFDEPFPTIRSVGQNMHAAQVGQEKHDAALLKTMKKLQNGFNAIQALEGTLGRDITPGARALNSWLVTYQSFRTLSTMLFTSFQDVAGIVVNGGEAGDAWNAFVEGIREIRNTVFDNKDPSQRMKDAEFWGTVDAGAFLETSSQAHGSPFMSGKAKQWSDTFFKYTGAVGWNRGVRAVATQVAERIITGWKTNGIDRSDKAAVARLEDLFGKGFDPANIKVTAEGRLDPSDVANQAAITRWVLTAVPAPTAAHRTIWMSDPHYAIFAQLKNYAYSFHRIMMKNAADQARLGNYRPVLAMLLGYTPIAIAAGAIKEMLIPGEEPPWMKGGLDGYLSYGFGRAGILGIPQVMLGSVLDVSQLPGGNFAKAGSAFDPASLAGPTADQVQNILSIPFGEFMAMRDHTIIGEGLGALPGGNLVKRLERLGSA
jgi:hypothetical protein